MRRSMQRLRLFGGIAIAAALVFPAVPALAVQEEPEEPVTKDVEITVAIGDYTPEPSLLLPGARVTVLTTDEPATELASGVSGVDGALTLSVTGLETS